MIGCDTFGKQAKFWIPIPFADVAKDLVVSAIFFDDVDAMFDGTRVAGSARNWITFGASDADLRIRTKRRAFEDFGSPRRHSRGKLFSRRQFDHAQGAAKQFADVLLQ